MACLSKGELVGTCTECEERYSCGESNEAAHVAVYYLGRCMQNVKR